MNWIEINIFTSWEATEAIADILHNVGVTGVVIEDPQLWQKKKQQAQFDEIWDLEVVADSDEVTVKGYLPEDELLTDRIEQVRSAVAKLPSFGLDLGRGEIKLNKVAEEDWATSWKAYFKPEHIGKFVVKPTWEDYSPKAGELIIHLDPGMAFGTGTHETTSMCLDFLQRYVKKEDLVYDVGTGSGILSIGAVLLGADRVWACDVDLVAVKVARDNAALNRQEKNIAVELGSLEKREEEADLIVSNIVANIIIKLAPNYAANLKPGGILITSGIISEREAEAAEALEKAGFTQLERKQEGDWVCLAWKKQ